MIARWFCWILAREIRRRDIDKNFLVNISICGQRPWSGGKPESSYRRPWNAMSASTLSAAERVDADMAFQDRKSTRLNSSHLGISYAVFCLKKKKKKTTRQQ